MGEGATAQRRAVEELAREVWGPGPLRIQPITPGLGTRRFYRVLRERGSPRSLIARVEAPEDPRGRPAGVAPEPALEPLRRLLAAQGLPVPGRIGGDVERGVELLEDLGDTTLESLATSCDAERRRALYREACALIPRLQRVEPGGERVAAFERRLGPELFEYKAARFVEWSLPQALGREARPSEAAVVREAFALVAEASARAPARLAHRDFKAANLHSPAHPAPGRRLVMIDLQGAFLAPPEYDLVCLLRDSHVALPEAEIAEHLEEVRPRLPDAPEPTCFARRFAMLTLTRVGKDHALYLYAARERGDRRYLDFVPRAASNLRRAARELASLDPRLARLEDLVARLPDRAGAATPR